jgi:hypothetical protein
LGYFICPGAKDWRRLFVLTCGSHTLVPQPDASCCSLGQLRNLLPQEEIVLTTLPLLGWVGVMWDSIGFGLQRVSKWERVPPWGRVRVGSVEIVIEND